MSGNKPLVSVFIVTYNSQDYIVEALDSVKSQTYQNIELIVSDDCSSDNTVSIVKDWMKMNESRFVRIEIVETPVNTGIPANYNRAVQACHGEWLKMMDGDDVLLDNCVEDNIRFVSEEPSARIVFSDMYMFKGVNSKILGKRFNKKRKTFFEKDVTSQTIWLLKGNILPSQTCFISASLLKNNPYNEKYRLLEDYPMWVKLSCNGEKYYYFDKCTAMYRLADSVSSNKKVLFPVNYLDVCRRFYLDEIYPLIVKYNAQEAYDYNRKYFMWYDACRNFLGNKRNVFTVPLYYIFGFVIFKLFRFKL